MDLCHTKIIKTQGLESKVATLRSLNYNTFISKDDPSRLKRVKLDTLLKSTLMLYDLCKETSLQGEERMSLPEANLSKQKYGKFKYSGISYILVYYACPIRVIEGNVYTSIVPIKASYNGQCATEGNILPLLIPFNKASYVVLDCESKCISDNIILCPGNITFTSIATKNGNYTVGIYSSLTVQQFTRICTSDDIQFTITSSKIDMMKVDNVIDYLIDYHVYRVQRGYYSPTGSTESRVFDAYGKKFYVSSLEDKSYYESVSSSKDVSSLEDTEVTELPLFDQTLKYVTVYAQGCNLYTAGIKFLSPSPSDVYDVPVDVDVRIIDLNFVWTQTTRDKDENLPSKSYYALSPQDTTYLQYAVHGPGILVAIHGKHIVGISRSILTYDV